MIEHTYLQYKHYATYTRFQHMEQRATHPKRQKAKWMENAYLQNAVSFCYTYRLKLIHTARKAMTCWIEQSQPNKLRRTISLFDTEAHHLTILALTLASICRTELWVKQQCLQFRGRCDVQILIEPIHLWKCMTRREAAKKKEYQCSQKS